MVKLNSKIVIMLALTALLFIGIASASENITDSIGIEELDEIPVEKTLKEDDLISNSSEITDSRSNPQIEVNDIVGYEGKELMHKATVKAENGSVTPAVVHFNFNGNTYTAHTDANGVASVALKFPKSKILKTTSKTKGNVLTKTTYYENSYFCDLTASGDGLYDGHAGFKVISKKTSVVKKYKIIKKIKIHTLKVKNGIKGFKKGNYAIITNKYKKGRPTYLETAMIHQDGKFIKFSIKHHVKKNGKWKWDKWMKIPKDKMEVFSFGKQLKIDKFKVKYTQVSYKRI